MNVLWQDNVPSFLDGSSPGGAGGFAASLGDGGAPWFASADGGLFSGQPVLWWDNGADSATADSGLAGVAGFDPGGAAGGWLPHGAEAFAGANPTLDGGLLWADPSGSTSNLVLTGPGVGQFDLTAGHGGPSQWQQLLGTSGHETWLANASTLLWTGGSDRAPLTPPVTSDTLHLTGGLAGPSVPTLAAEQLTWTDPSTAGLASGPNLGVAEPALTQFPRTLGVPAQSPTGLLPRLGGTP
jgi:hypothetical protein